MISISKPILLFKSIPTVKMYASKKGDLSVSGQVVLYDIYGREVLVQPLEHNNLMKIPFHISNNYLVVKVISNNKVFTSKVYIK